MLLGATCPRAALVAHLAGGEARGALRFWSHFGKTDGVITYVPDYEPLDVPDAWRPEYELMAPLYAPDGELAGTISPDRPRDGRIPPPWANEFLGLFAGQAVIAILNARRHEQALRAMRTLEQERVALHAAFAEQRARETDLRDQTRRDPLTSLANRVLLQGRLEELLSSADREMYADKRSRASVTGCCSWRRASRAHRVRLPISPDAAVRQGGWS
jgi:hypothetical protein